MTNINIKFVVCEKKNQKNRKSNVRNFQKFRASFVVRNFKQEKKET